jgi:diacylglycerol kinase (ATP)
MMHRRYKLIANPRAGRGRASSLALRIVELFHARGQLCDLELTRGPNDAARIAQEAPVDYDVIVAVGGDGTVNEIIPGMLPSARPLAVVPAGSGNDFIKSLGVPNDLERAVDIAINGKTRTIDLGRINGRYFANGVGIGFDAAVNKASYSINHSKRGLLLYLCALFKTLGNYEPVPMDVTMNGEMSALPLFILSVGNGTTVGGGFKLTPHARLDDGLLDVTMIKPIGLLPLFWHLPKVFLGTIDRVVRYAATTRTDRLVVESRQAVPVHIDGEIYTDETNRFEIDIVPQALTVIGNFPDAPAVP